MSKVGNSSYKCRIALTIYFYSMVLLALLGVCGKVII
jgi:type IV secretory pathway TrbL component